MAIRLACALGILGRVPIPGKKKLSFMQVAVRKTSTRRRAIGVSVENP